MKKNIELCGLGNSLVDIQVSVDDNFIKEVGLVKGEMRLAEQDEQKRILDMLSDREINLCSGGSAANSIIAFAKFGGKASYMSLLGNDRNGVFYADEFKELGIELKAEMLEEESTGTCLVLITPDSERTMCTSLAATGKFGPGNLDHDMIKRAEWLYVEGYKFTAEASTDAIMEAVKTAKEIGTKIALTFSDGFITTVFKDKLTEVAKQSDLIFCNENEALSFTGETNFKSAYDKLSLIAPNLAVTLGSKGSLVKWEGKDYEIPPYDASPVDSTGAGDIYAGGFLYGIIKDNNPVIAGNLGSLAASKIVSQLGARLKENHAELVNQIKEKVKN